ncbi:MAG: helix-turn-helix domain-containing protein [Oscillospiraceae bacterium]
MFYENFTNLCKDKGFSPTSLLQRLNISTSKLTAWKNGSMPNSSFVILIAEFFGVSTDYLLTGKEKSSPTDLTADEQELLTYYKDLNDIDKGIVIGRAEALLEKYKTPLKEPKNTIFIEYYSLPVSAGTGVYLDGCEKDMVEVEETPLTIQANFALRVSGDSMEPVYHNGDIVLIESQPTVEIGEVGIFIVNGEGYIKKFGGNKLISLNPDYSDIILNEDDSVYCRGKVIGVV